MELPKFLARDGRSLVFNQDNATFVFYVPTNYFNNTSKVTIAEYYGEYVTSIGLLNWAIIDDKGKRSPIKPFLFPTMFMCKPGEIDTTSGKNMQLDNTPASDYVLLKFRKGDEVVSDIRVPKDVTNVEIVFKMFMITAKIPTTIPYDKLWEIFYESANLNGFSFGMNVQLFWFLIANIARDPDNPARRFSATDMKDMNGYTLMDIKKVPKYISPYTAITSENFDEAIRAASLIKNPENTPESPMEKILTM